MSTTVVFPLLPMVNTVAQFSEDHELILHRLSANFFYCSYVRNLPSYTSRPI